MSGPSPPDSAARDLDALRHTLLPFAEKMVRRRGGFAPFGGLVTVGGQTEHVGAYLGEGPVGAEELLALLKRALGAHARDGAIRAAGWCQDVRFSHPGRQGFGDAILLCLEHAEGEALEELRPYRRRLLGRTRFGEPVSRPKEREVFG